MTAVAMGKPAATTDTAARFRPTGVDFATYNPKHFLWSVTGKVATITLNRPERKNPLTLESYAELRDLFRPRRGRRRSACRPRTTSAPMKPLSPSRSRRSRVIDRNWRACPSGTPSRQGGGQMGRRRAKRPLLCFTASAPAPWRSGSEFRCINALALHSGKGFFAAFRQHRVQHQVQTPGDVFAQGH